ncbi:MAG: hypothetical protein H5U38_12345, partial [Calditrichaeota bacterium]|nr:hypothetical protein [Calditrichota bacterium]
MMHPIQDRFRTTWQALPHPDRRWVLAALISCVCTVAVYFGLWFARPKPPLLLLDQARMALSAARHADAPTYAPKLWQEAEDSWEYTVRAFREQRRRWFFRRDFSTAARLAQRTHTLALQAQTRALAARDSLAEHARTAATAAQREIDEYRAHFRDLPGSRTYRERAVRSELLLLEAQAAARRGDLLRAAERLREARAAISLAGNGSANTVRAYFAK